MTSGYHPCLPKAWPITVLPDYDIRYRLTCNKTLLGKWLLYPNEAHGKEQQTEDKHAFCHTSRSVSSFPETQVDSNRTVPVTFMCCWVTLGQITTGKSNSTNEVRNSGSMKDQRRQRSHNHVKLVWKTSCGHPNPDSTADPSQSQEKWTS